MQNARPGGGDVAGASRCRSATASDWGVSWAEYGEDVSKAAAGWLGEQKKAGAGGYQDSL